MSLTIGFAAERKACAYLRRQGLRHIASNYRCRLGEIDLIMQDDECLVFVEVRARGTAAYGSASDSVTFSKQQKLIRTATHYLVSHDLYDKSPNRFDVISIEGHPPQIHWIRHAFDLSG